MPVYEYSLDDKLLKGDHACFGVIFQAPSKYNILLPYAKQLAVPAYNRSDYGYRYYVEEAVAKRHVELMHAAGFKFTFTTGEYDFRVPGRNETRDRKPESAYIFKITKDENAPVMVRFLLNTIRQPSYYTSCVKAWHTMVADTKIDLEDSCTIFNMLVISTCAQLPTSSHNVGLYALPKPFTQAQFDALRKSKTNEQMANSITCINAPEWNGKNMDFLLKPGGYEKYMTILNAEESKISKAMAAAREATGKALGINFKAGGIKVGK